MNITYNSVTIPFFDFEVPSHLVMSLSGGIDSASLMYLTCKHFPQIEIIPVTLSDVNGGVDAAAAANITTWMQTEFPAVTIRDLQTFDFNDQDESIVTNAQCDQMMADHPDQYANRSSASKSIQIDNILQGVSSSYLRMNGMTLNPPADEMVAIHQNFYDMSERCRDAGETPKGTEFIHTVGGNKLYQAYSNIDKKFVADIYVQNNLMETLFPLTRSCVGATEDTVNFTLECHNCFWCFEKKWAFNLPHQDPTVPTTV